MAQRVRLARLRQRLQRLQARRLAASGQVLGRDLVQDQLRLGRVPGAAGKRAAAGGEHRLDGRQQARANAVAGEALVGVAWVFDPAEVASVALANAGFPAGLIASWIGDAAVKARLKETTDEAVARGVFGAPTMFVGDEMFFGQDRLEWVREALGAA